VAKRKCGTCRYFEEAGLAGSGWCHHPDRETSTDVLIMVRRNELACRDEWDHNLWEGAGGTSDGETPLMRRPGLGPQRPASATNLQSLLDRDVGSGAAAATGEDVLLSEARIVSESQQPWQPPPRSAVTAGFDPRSAIFRAREAYRERARARIVAERQSSRTEAVASQRTGEANLVSAEVGNHQAEAAENLSVSVETAEEENVLAPRFTSLSLEDEACAVDQTQTRAAAQETLARPSAATERTAVLDHVTSDQLSTELERGWSSTSVKMSEATVCPAEIELEAPAVVPLSEARPAPARVNELPAWFRSDLPRVCRSCRDYRPAADGQRGWCANNWAFTHSRLVHGDEGAPCQSAIGDWWVPADDVWLVAADVSSHGRATPLLDQFVAREKPRQRRS
jgi:hypothetical protein